MTLLDSLLAIGMSIFLVGIFANEHLNSRARIEQRLAAEQLLQVARGARAHLAAHASEYAASATRTSGPTIALADLAAEGLLPPSFAGKNVWGQGYSLHVRSTQRDGALRVVVLTEGGRSGTARFRNVHVPGAALLAGAGAGYVPAGNVEGMPAGSLTGAGGTWSIPLAASGLPDPGPGHLGHVGDFDASDLGDGRDDGNGDVLSRVEIPGHPERNAMETTLDMTGNAIRDAGEVQFRDRAIDAVSCTDAEDQGKVFYDGTQGLYLCRDGKAHLLSDSGNAHALKGITIVSSGALVDKPVCGSGTVPAIFVAPSIAATGAEAQPIAAFQTWASNRSDTRWQVHMRLLSSGTSGVDAGNVTDREDPLPDYNRILTFTSCAPETP
jgi:hypothetical protein